MRDWNSAALQRQSQYFRVDSIGFTSVLADP
jgi:hypothetical protein